MIEGQSVPCKKWKYHLSEVASQDNFVLYLKKGFL